MSFSFSAVGSREEVIGQLSHVKEGTHGTGGLGHELAELLAKHLDEVAKPAADYRYCYVVEASGHSGGGSATSLTVSVRPMYVRQAASEQGVAPGPE